MVSTALHMAQQITGCTNSFFTILFTYSNVREWIHLEHKMGNERVAASCRPNKINKDVKIYQAINIAIKRTEITK